MAGGQCRGARTRRFVCGTCRRAHAYAPSRAQRVGAGRGHAGREPHPVKQQRSYTPALVLGWDFEFPDPADRDEGARPWLETFLTLHTPFAGDLPKDREPSEEEITLALTRRGKPHITKGDFRGLITQLQHAGYGWLRPEGVRAKLKEMAAEWQGLP